MYENKTASAGDIRTVRINRGNILERGIYSAESTQR
jgi:hypothetical protein